MSKKLKLGKRNKSGKGVEFNKNNKKRFINTHRPNHSAIKKNSKASTNPDVKVSKENQGFKRDRNTINRLNMYRDKPDM
jgi:hypothetical protein